MSNQRFAGALILSLLAIAVLPGAVSPVGTASASMCYLDPDDPVPGVECGVEQTAGCVVAIVKAILNKKPLWCPA